MLQKILRMKTKKYGIQETSVPTQGKCKEFPRWCCKGSLRIAVEHAWLASGLSYSSLWSVGNVTHKLAPLVLARF